MNNKNNKELKMDEIMEFYIPKEYFSQMTEDEIEKFNGEMFSAMVGGIISSSSAEATTEQKEEMMRIMRKSDEPKEILEYIGKNIKEGYELIGKEVYNFKKEIAEIYFNK